MKQACFLALLGLLIAGCSDEKVPGGRITIKNDILDKEYNVISIDQVVSNKGMSSFKASLSPGQEVTIPQKNVRSLRFTREYEDHAKIYVVQCSKKLNKQITMKLIDIHLNKLSGGCKLVKRGKQEHGSYVKWE